MLLRLWLILLLLLTPRPDLAMAQQQAPSHAGDVLAQDAPDVEGIQGVSGFECLRCADTRQVNPTSPQHSYLRSRASFRLVCVLSLADSEQRPPVDAVCPLCERLPYDATAPPAMDRSHPRQS